MQLIQSTGADTYARSPAEWRDRAAAGSAVRADFAELLGDMGTAGKATTTQDAASTDAAGEPAPAATNEKKSQKKDKKKKDHDPLSDVLGVAIAAGKVAAARKLEAAGKLLVAVNPAVPADDAAVPKKKTSKRSLDPGTPQKLSKASKRSSTKSGSSLQREDGNPSQAVVANTIDANAAAAAATSVADEARPDTPLSHKKSKRRKSEGSAAVVSSEAAASGKVEAERSSDARPEGQKATEKQKRSKDGAVKADKSATKKKQNGPAEE